MPVFSYIARDNSGTTVQGELTAENQADAARVIRNEGKFVVSIQHKGHAWSGAAANAPASGGRFGDRLNPDDLIFFTTQMAVMTDTGVALADALEACVHDGNSPRFARALHSVIDTVNAGTEFSAALAEHPGVFPQFFVSLIKASEATGQLGPILERLAEHLKRQREMTRKIKGAVIYPIVMLVFAIGVTIFLVSFVLPKFSEIYAGREDSLPALTGMLLEFSDSFITFGPYLLAVLIAAVVGIVYYTKTPNGRRQADHLQLRLPMIGPLYHKAHMARSLRTLGTMIQSGVSMLEGVQLTMNVCSSQQYREMWGAVHERVEGGQQISTALSDHKAVPKSVIKMLNAGERSGQLGPVMERVASFSEAELGVALKTITGLIEPAIIMFLGVVVGGLVLALLLPIFTISKAL